MDLQSFSWIHLNCSFHTARLVGRAMPNSTARCSLQSNNELIAFYQLATTQRTYSEHIQSNIRSQANIVEANASDRWRGTKLSTYNFMYIEMAAGRHCLRMFRICFTLIWPTSSWFFICLHCTKQKNLTVWLLTHSSHVVAPVLASIWTPNDVRLPFIRSECSLMLSHIRTEETLLRVAKLRHDWKFEGKRIVRSWNDSIWERATQNLTHCQHIRCSTSIHSSSEYRKIFQGDLNVLGTDVKPHTNLSQRIRNEKKTFFCGSNAKNTRFLHDRVQRIRAGALSNE